MRGNAIIPSGWIRKAGWQEMRGNTIIPSGWIRKAGWQETRGNTIITYNTKRLECEGGGGGLGGGGMVPAVSFRGT